MNNFLSERLLTIASMIDDGKTVYDVGCDHAYLDIYLTLHRHLSCYAIDIRPSAVKIARENINKFQLNIPVWLNNGLDNILIEKNSTVVLAGMGTRTILKILENKKIEEMIIQSNDDLPLLRDLLSKQGYTITDEKVVLENHYFYVLIKFATGHSHYSEEELLLGPKLMQDKNNSTYRNYLHNFLRKLDKMISHVPDELREKKSELLEKKRIMKNYLDTKK